MTNIVANPSTKVLTFQQMHRLLEMKNEIRRDVYRDIEDALRSAYYLHSNQNEIIFVLHNDPMRKEREASCVEVIRGDGKERRF